MKLFISALLFLILFQVSSCYADNRDKLKNISLGLDYNMYLPYDDNFEKSNYKPSHGFGLSFNLYNDKGWGYTSGINYGTIINKFNIDFTENHERDPSNPVWYDTTLSYGKFKSVHQYLELPLMMNYTFKFNWFKLKLDIGHTFTYNFRNFTNGSFLYDNGSIENSKYVYKNNRRFCIYPTLGISLIKSINDYNIHLSPSLRFGDISNNSDYDWLIGCSVGLNKTIK